MILMRHEESQSNPENNLQEQIISETFEKEQNESDKQKYVAKLMDKLKDMDDSDEDEDDPDEEAIDDNDSNDVPTKESSDNERNEDDPDEEAIDDNDSNDV